MSIAAIIEKYKTEIMQYYGGGESSKETVIDSEDFPALTAELETLMREEACKFSEQLQAKGIYQHPVNKRWYKHGQSTGGKTTAELYDKFINQSI